MNETIPTPIADYFLDLIREQNEYESKSWIKRWWMRRRGYRTFKIFPHGKVYDDEE